MLENKHNDQSIATFIYASEIYPNSANVFDSLAEALSAVQRHKEAKVAMEKAVALGTANHHYNLAYFKEHLAPVILLLILYQETIINQYQVNKEALEMLTPKTLKYP